MNINAVNINNNNNNIDIIDNVEEKSAVKSSSPSIVVASPNVGRKAPDSCQPVQDNVIAARQEEQQVLPQQQPKSTASNSSISSSNRGSNPSAKAARRLRTNSLPQQQQQQQSIVDNRPAVIILNDERENENDFTFGFDVNDQLLFGGDLDENGMLLEALPPRMPSVVDDDEVAFVLDNSPSNTDNSRKQQQMEAINTSDYNSYNSSLSLSSSSLTATIKGSQVVSQAAAEGPAIGFDNNNNASNMLDSREMTEEMVQSTPNKQQHQQHQYQQQLPPQQVTNCTNCNSSLSANHGAALQEGTVLHQLVQQPQQPTLMRNSCVQTSLDNLVIGSGGGGGDANSNSISIDNSSYSNEDDGGYDVQEGEEEEEDSGHVEPSPPAAVVSLPRSMIAVRCEDLENSNNKQGGNVAAIETFSQADCISIKQKLQQLEGMAPTTPERTTFSCYIPQNHEKIVNFVGMGEFL